MFKKYEENLLDKLIDSDKDAITELTNLFNKSGYELYLVGGCVRDLLLGKEPKDIDLCTSATPDEMKEIIKDTYFKSWDSGVKHGTLTITCDFPYYCSFEVTTFRIDGAYEDHRRPDEVKLVRSLEEDLKRRDLTINSFAYDSNTKELIMLDESFYYDLQFGIIRTVGKAEDRFTEDALRMLRAIRFAAQLGFSISEATFKAIKSLADTIKYVSKERIRDELTKIITSEHAELFSLVARTGLADALGLPKQCVFHMDDSNYYKRDSIVRWAAFLRVPHLMPEGKEEEVIKFLDTYKFDNATKKAIILFVENEYTLDFSTDLEFKQVIATIGDDLIEKYFDFLTGVFLSKDVTIQLAKHKDRYLKIKLNNEPLYIKDLAINGDDLVEIGLSGKQIGETLTKCLEHVYERPEDNKKDILLDFIKSF